MATFTVRDDIEKENRETKQLLQQQHGLKNLNEKRSANVFGVLDNKTTNRIDNNQLIKPNAGNVDDNNYGQHIEGKLIGNKKHETTSSSVPVEQFSKAFYVYEDNQKTSPDDKENDKSIASSSTSINNISTGRRYPLSELKEDEGPMSIDKTFSPMSVDKSMSNLNTSLIQQQQSQQSQQTNIKNDRERFFEIEEYQMDILEYLKEAEKRHRPKYGYMKKQPDITHSMRTILVDWLVEVCEEYRLQSETFCLAISYIDRFLSYMSVVRAKLQLVGTAALFIAAKYEEIYPPDVAEFVYITDDTYTKMQVLRMEKLLLKVLSFDLTVPTPLMFVNMYAVLFNLSTKLKCLTSYICELSMLEDDPYLQFLPSQISAASFALARYMLGMPMWSKTFDQIIGYNLESLRDLILRLNYSVEKAQNLPQQAIQEKYKQSKNCEVSSINPCNLDISTFDQILEKLNTTMDNSEIVQENNENVRKMMSSLIFD